MVTLSRSLIVSALLAAMLSAPATAQVDAPPPRDYGGIFGGTPRPDQEQDRLRQELDLTVNLLGGYDDTVRPQGVVAAPVDTRLRESGYTGSADALLRYWRGRGPNWFSLQGHGYVNGYSNLDIGASSGGSFNAQAQAAVGRRGTLDVAQRVSSDPFFTFSSFSALEPIVGPGGTPGTDAFGSGLFERRSWTTNSSARWRQEVGRRDSLTLSYGFSQRRFVDDDRGNNRSHNAGVSYRRQLGRTHAIRLGYRFTDREFTEFSADADVNGTAPRSRPVTTHTIEGGPELTKRLSPSRNLFVSLGGGAMRVRTLARVDRAPLEYWRPFGQAALRVDLARSWSLGANYRRGVTVLEGVTHEAFVTDSGSVRLGGYLGRRVDLTLSGGYSVGAFHLSDGGTGELQTTTASAQLRFALARQAAIFTEYAYYRYRFADPTGPAFGFPPEFDRNAVRVGLSFWVPLAGHYRAPRQW